MTEVEIRALVLEGEAYLKIGDLRAAYGTFLRAGHKDGLIACGNKALEEGWLDAAREAFAAAGTEMPK
ncbi:MAG TPA: hypothetical protein VF590_00365, partial [Isosphaeraceae bacterium]